MVKVFAFIQCRLNSNRLPGKALINLYGELLLERVIGNVKLAKSVDEIYVLSSDEEFDDILEYYVEQCGVKWIRGSLNNVFERFLKALEITNPDYFVRVTADNPLIEPSFIDLCVEKAINENLDYVKMLEIPVGTGSEVVKSEIFKNIPKEQLTDYDKEHVTPYIYNNADQFKLGYIEPSQELAHPEISLTLDTLSDYVKIQKIFQHYQRPKITLREAISYFITST